MTDDLVAFLRARLDEDERTAREAATTAAAAIGEHVHKIGAADGRPYNGTWWTNDYDHVFARDPRPGRKLQGMVADCGYGALGLTTHIARHDPTRVLRDVEAKRRIVDLMAGILAAAENDSEVDHYGGLGAAEDALHLLALPYDGHPDYRAESKQ